MPELFVAPERKRLLAIDVLRGIAALAVVLTHIPHSHGNEVGWKFFALLPLDFGSIGVPLFLVLSGFCIHLGRARKIASGEQPHTEWLPFWKRRFFRLYPPYVAAMVFSTAIFAFIMPTEAAAYLSDFRKFGWDLISHLGMFHNLTENYWDGMSNPPFWSLGLEEQLYALFFVMLLLRTKHSALNVLKISLVVTLAWRFAIPLIGWAMFHLAHLPRANHVVPVGPFDLGNWTMWPFGWWFLWVIGAVAAEVWCGLVRLPDWVTSRRSLYLFVAIGLITHKSTLGRFSHFWVKDEGSLSLLRLALEIGTSLSDVAIAVAGAIVLLRWLKAEKQKTFQGVSVDILAWVGTISYSLYLTHYRTIFLVEHLVPGIEQSGMLFRFAVYIPACLFVAWCFYQLIERHFLGSSVHRDLKTQVTSKPQLTKHVEPISVRRQNTQIQEPIVAKIES